MDSTVEPALDPPSPSAAPVRLSDCMEELMRFTLSASFPEDFDASLGLPQEYCDKLLREDPYPSNLHDGRGVPAYPLYKHLARALECCISSGTFFRELRSAEGVREDETLMVKRKELDRLITEKGTDLVNMMDGVEFELHVQEPFFSQLRNGLKTIEGRCATGDYNRISAGSLLLINKSLLLKVQDVRQYTSFLEMLQVELANSLPGIQKVEEGVQIYRKFYTEEKEKCNGVLAIHVSKTDSQPYISLGNLLSVDGCSLTDAARSLEKHIHRSSERWWGRFCGNESEKNRLAFEVVNSMLNKCCWMNVYVVQPLACVFEIRVHEGYGARWSKDGSKFLGFLEPYTKDGHSKGWKH